MRAAERPSPTQPSHPPVTPAGPAAGIESSGHLLAILESSLDCIIMMDHDGRVIEFNPAAERTFGHARAEVVGKILADLLIPQRLRGAHRQGLARYLATGRSAVLNHRVQLTGLRADGSEFPLELAIARVKVPGPPVFSAFLRDVSRQRADEQSLRESEAGFRSLFEDNPQPMLLMDRETLRYVAANRAALSLYGYAHHEFLKLRPTDLRLDEEHGQLQIQLSELAAGNAIHFEDIRHHGKSGDIIDVEIDIQHTRFQGRSAFLLVITNVTDRARLQRELEHQAFHDLVTGLPNRLLFTDRVTQALARSARGHPPVVVLFLDIDNFKTINDSLGHAAGDALLRSVAERLQQPLRSVDSAARFGGDEFAVLLEDVTDPNHVAHICERIAAVLSTPVVIHGTTISTQVSIGVACGSHADEVEQLLRNADIAMYGAKSRGKARYQLYDPQMHQRVAQRLQLESDLRQALDRDEFRIHYQPVLELPSLRVVGVEALVRWLHPQRGLMPPLEFIGLAEDTGVIVALGAWVLTQACAQVRCWQRDIPGMEDLNAAVNLSPRQLEDAAIVDGVRQTLAVSGLAPAKLVLEVTEGVLMRDVKAACLRLEELAALGIKLAIDDFGTGHSSLAHLRQLPVHILKVDKSFVDAIHDDPAAAELLSVVVRLGHSLGMDVVTEGVELTEQAAVIEGLGQVYVQGYLYSRPLDVESMTTFLKEHRPSLVALRV